MVFGIIFLAAAVWLLYWLLTKNNIFPQTNPETPLDIAKLRYAKGEITKKQYQEIKEEIKG